MLSLITLWFIFVVSLVSVLLGLYFDCVGGVIKSWCVSLLLSLSFLFCLTLGGEVPLSETFHFTDGTDATFISLIIIALLEAVGWLLLDRLT